MKKNSKKEKSAEQIADKLEQKKERLSWNKMIRMLKAKGALVE